MAEKMDLKLLIDEVNSRVVFLECDKDFVDVLLSFLVMPIGAIVRLTDKVSGLGCMDALYESVEKLDVSFFQTQACKDLLLRPKNAWRSDCNKLSLRIDHEPQHHYYVCSSFYCKYNSSSCDASSRYCSPIKNARCKCGRLMAQFIDTVFSDSEATSGDDIGVFVKGKNKYIISEDLHISLASSSSVLVLLKELGIMGCNKLHGKVVQVGREEVLHLLKRAMVSKTPLSNVFLSRHDQEIHIQLFRSCQQIRIPANDSNVSSEKKLSMKLFLIRSTKRVLYAEANEDVVDFLFSFLTFPLGILPNLHKDILPLGCIRHLQTSVSELSAQNQLRTAEHSSMLLQPKLAPHHRCQNQILKIDEDKLKTLDYGQGRIRFTAINPKLSRFTTDEGGGFVKRPLTFTITDGFNVKDASAFASVAVFRDSSVLVEEVEEKVVKIGEEEALMLLRASLVSKSPLSDTFG